MSSSNDARPQREHSVKIASQYALDVLSGKRVAGDLVRQACQRHLDDLEGGAERGIRFDAEDAAIALEFFRLLRFSTGEWAGKPFWLEPWQQFIVASLFGWKREDGTRRFRTAYAEMARKNGKSCLLAGVGVYMLVADGEPRAEVYSAATKRDQAKIIWEEAKQMVKRSPSFAGRVFASMRNLSVGATGSKFEPLGADKDTLDGLNIHCALVDELHAHKNPGLYEVLSTATGARRQPMVISITTAGSDKTRICWEQHEYSTRVLSGVIEDDSFFAFIAALDKDDDWTDESVWEKANPNLGVSAKIETLRDDVRSALASPRKQNEIRRLKFNEWTRAETRFLDAAKWEACAGDLTPSELEELHDGEPCWAGLDLSSTTDITAFVMVWPPAKPGGTFDVAARFWIPAAGIEERERKAHVPYQYWVEQGWIEATEGDVIDYGFVYEEILRCDERHQIASVYYDRWNSLKIATELADAGILMVKFGQGSVSMNAPCKELERLVMCGGLRHGGNPVLSWMADNLEVKTDAGGNLKPMKPDYRQSAKKIDGMSALLNAIGAVTAMDGSPQEPSVYEERGILTL